MTRWMTVAVVACAAAVAAEARVKLVALPDRARSVAMLDHPDRVLVQEERILTLQKGANEVDFSWKGVAVDAASVQIQVLDHPAEVRVLNASYPPGENSLVWSIASPEAREERIRIAYIVAGLRRENVYKAVTRADETALDLKHYVRLLNDSGEDLADAELRFERDRVFTRSLAHGEVLEMLLDRADEVPIRKRLRWDAASMPWDPEYERDTPGIPLAYVVMNDRASKLGEGPVLPGKARIFLMPRGATGRESPAFTGEDWVELTPADRELELEIGQSRDVKVTQRQLRNDRQNIRRNNGNREVLWDTDEEMRVVVENFKKDPVAIVVVEHIPGCWKMGKSSHEYVRKDAFTLEYELTLKPESKETITFRYSRLNVQGHEPASY